LKLRISKTKSGVGMKFESKRVARALKRIRYRQKGADKRESVQYTALSCLNMSLAKRQRVSEAHLLEYGRSDGVKGRFIYTYMGPD